MNQYSKQWGYPVLIAFFNKTKQIKFIFKLFSVFISINPVCIYNIKHFIKICFLFEQYIWYH